MTNDLEKSLAAEFASAARHAPRPVPDLRERIEHGHRRRRRRGVALYAAAAVVVLSAGVPFTVDAVTPANLPDVAERPTPAPDRTFPLIEQVWPKAVRTIPKKLPNGRPFQPELFMNQDTVLARTLKDGNVDKMDGLWAYDLVSGQARRLVQVTPPPKTVVTAPFILTGGGRLAWWTVHKRQGRPIVNIWTAPASGGAQRKVTSFAGVPRFGGIDMQIVGDLAVWSLWGKKGVYQVPLSGGTPRLLPGSEGNSLVSWPWAGDPGAGRGPGQKEVIFGNLRNLQTGEQRRAKAGPRAGCHVTWCVWDRTALRRDGTVARELPGMSQGALPALDRFLLLLQVGAERRLTGQVLYDLSTGRAGALGVRPTKKGLAAATLDYRSPGLLSFERNGQLVVVDLTAIK
ncbi:hypothetical protein ABZ897_15025 [Nonomuraea sp. NPDC046802]|uniref:TolB family protein n=1 Tax=Nonomuraea sp. NPDC046802 TaxID=3154919 RepID=UPI0033D17DC6